MGSCVLRETIRQGRPRFAPRVSLSIYLSIPLRPRFGTALQCAMATRDAQRCLAAGSGRWEPIADWSSPPYTLQPNTYESRLSAYAPHLCDRGKTSNRPAVKWRWMPEGPGCSALRLPADTRILTTAFCRRFAGSSILIVGESVQAC